MTKTLTLRVKAEYFDQIKSGEKIFEFREITEYWSRRITGKCFDFVTIIWGYPSKDRDDCYLTFPWRGYEIQEITHPQFGPKPVEVFAIRLETSEGANMADKTTTPRDPQDLKKKPKTVKKIDFGKPLYMGIYQTPSSNVVEYFQGKDAKGKATEWASQKSVGLKRTVAVVGPQCVVKVPPAPVEAGDLDLTFLSGSEGEA